MSGARLLVVTSVAAERAAIQAGVPADRAEAVTVVAGGVGPASAAAATMEALRERFAAVVCAGIGGGFAVPAGGLTIGTGSIAADLGAASPEGFLSLDDLGLGPTALPCDPDLVAALQIRLPDAVPGSILAVTTVTGTAERERELRSRHPGAVAEAMEGFGVATAAARAGLPFAEVRAISNAVGPRDRAAWRIADALAALERAGAALATLVP